MAWSGEEPLKSEQVAESVNTNPVVIRRILKELAEAGLVVSQTGSLGGSVWHMTATETTLLDVYQALEYGGVFSLHRAPPSRDCPVGVNIETVLGDVLLEVDTAVEKVLKNITINDVVRRLKPCGAAVASKSQSILGEMEEEALRTEADSFAPNASRGEEPGERILPNCVIKTARKEYKFVQA
jgi:DNA-binding IscR family transcriptional regulator